VRHDSFTYGVRQKFLYIYLNTFWCPYRDLFIHTHGVATISRLLKIIGLFCSISFSIGLFWKRPIIWRNQLIVATTCPYGDVIIHTYTFIHIDTHDAHTVTYSFIRTLTFIHVDTHMLTCDTTHSYEVFAANKFLRHTKCGNIYTWSLWGVWHFRHVFCFFQHFMWRRLTHIDRGSFVIVKHLFLRKLSHI